MRLLCAGDLHLGAGADLGREPGERLAEQEAALDRLVDLALELEVGALLWAGDAWERRRPTPAEILAFRRPLQRLAAHDVPVVVVPGNHDVEAWKRPTGYDLLAPARELWLEAVPRVVTLPHELEDEGVAIACLPWAPASHLVALEGGGDRQDLNRRLADGLVDVARGLFVTAGQIAPAAPKVLLAHWSVGGASTPGGIPTELFQEPVLDAAALAAIGFDAIVLGHIHKPQTIEQGAAPFFYVGSPMPLNFGEIGAPHGCYLLDVEGTRHAPVDRIVRVPKAASFFLPLESRPLVTLELEPVQGDDVRIALERPASEYGAGCLERLLQRRKVSIDGAIVKVKIAVSEEGARRIDVGGFRGLLEDAGAHKVWSVQVDVEKAELVRGAAIDETIDDTTALRLWLAALPEAERLSGAMLEETIDLHSTVTEAP